MTRILSTFVLVLFAISLFINSPPIPVNKNSNELVVSNLQMNEQQRTFADYPFNFTQVSWDQETVNEQRVDQWNSTRYRFGPTVNWHTRNATTGTIVPWDSEIPIDSWFDFIVEVPYNALSGPMPHAIAFQGSYFNLSEMKDGDMMDVDPSPIMMLGIYYITEGKWEIYSNKDAIWPNGPPSLPENFTLEDVFGPMVEPYMELDEVNSVYALGVEAYWARFRVRCNSSTLPGFYMFNAIALDSSYQTIAESRQSEQSGRLLGINLHGIVNEAFGGYYTITRVDDDGELLYTANRGEDFNFTVTISNATIMSNASIHLSSPSTIKIQKWVYGPYYEEQVRDGAWEWNELAGTYFWNDSAVVTWAEPKFGYHWEDTYTWVDMGREYNHINGEGFPEIWDTWPEYVISRNFETSSWEYFASYHYENHTWNGEYWEVFRWEEYEPWPSDYPIPFILNETTSSVYWNNLSKLVVNFRGHISEEMLPSGEEYGDTIHVWEFLSNTLGQKLVNYVDLPITPPQASLDYENLKTLAIDTPVSIVRLTHKGEPYSPSWIFQANTGETFTVSSRLQGGIELTDTIDGIAFIMYGHQERFGFDLGIDWHQYSDIELHVKVNPAGGVQINVYNYTVRTQWGYGEHYEWREVMIAPGIYETQRILVEDWFWEELIWDFEANDWTNQHFPMQSIRAKMPISFVTAGNVTYDIIGDDLKVSFDITPTPSMPGLEWWWDYQYGNLTWVTDYESGWGSHTVLGWTEDTVYHYYNNTEMWYVEQPYVSPIFRNNATGELYERSKIPYVIINGQPEPLKSYIFGEFEDTYETLLREEYDYVLDENRYFIKMLNGTELEVFGDQIAVIYNISLPMLGSWFLSFNDYPQWMGFVEGNDYYYMIATNGSIVTGTWSMMWSGYSSVRYDVAPVAMAKNTYLTYATPIAPFQTDLTIPVAMVGWPQSVGSDHWIMYLNSTWEPIDFRRYWEDDNLYYYHNFTDGRMYVFEWPWELMECNYMGKNILLPQYATKLFAYVTVGGSNYPIPKAGEPLNGWWDLDWVIQNKYSQEIAFINGTAYNAHKLQEWVIDHWEPYQEYNPGPPSYWYYVYQVNISGTVYNLTDWGWDPWESTYVMNYQWFPDSIPWVTKANGSLFVPEVFHTDWTVAVGSTNFATLEFEPETWLDVITGYYNGDYHSSYIYSWNSTGGYNYVMTQSGEEFVFNSTWRAVFHNITLSNGTYFYSAMDHPQIWPSDVTNWEVDTFYMVDIYGVEHWWYGWDEFTSEVVVITNVTGDPWINGTFWFEGADVPMLEYNATFWEWFGQEWKPRYYDYNQTTIWPQYYDFLQAKNGTIYELVQLGYTPESYRYNFPSWQFFSDEVWYNISGKSDMIYKAYRFEGYSKKLDFAPLPVSVISVQDAIITGAPEWGMWDVDIWTVNPETGALDLDGNLDTTNDQFFIKEFHSSTDSYNITHDYLDVSIYWEPNSTSWADEFYLNSFTGMVTFNWTFSWAENYIWTKAETGETLTSAEFDDLKNILFDQWGNPKPGYWGIAWLAENFTSADLLQQAIDEGWDWVPDNSREWSWLWWELDEHYTTDAGNETHPDLMDINLAYQYAGMFAWEDENDDNFMDIDVNNLGAAEMTHYWMPVDVDSVSFVTPGQGWGNMNSTGSEYRPVDETIDFGVAFENVTGIVFPFGEFSYWDWYDGQYHGSDFATFNERPTECLTEEFSINVHFTGIVNETGSNIAEVKFDIAVGDWDLNTPGGTNVLEDISLAISFFSDLTIVSGDGSAVYYDDLGEPLSNEAATASNNYTMATGNSSVALMSLGGAPYSWSKNMSYPATAIAQTVPLSAMSAIYLSGSGGTATTFSISSEQFYTLIGFKWWDGFAVNVDPIFVGYISPGTTDTYEPTFGSTLHFGVNLAGVDNVHIEAQVADTGGSELAEVKVWDTDHNQNYSMSYNVDANMWEVDIPRSIDGRYDFHYQIVAIDNAGNEAITSPQTFMFRDNLPPSIDSLNIVNGTDIMGDEIASVTITASDTGGSGVDYAVLTYWNTTGQFNVPMTFSAGSYTGEIPNHLPGTIVQYGVTVYDVDGNSVWSGWDAFTFWGADIAAPSVTLVFHDPTSPGSADSVTVSADIQDVSGVTYAVLQYSIDLGAWNNITMSSEGTTWSGVIPAQADGASVRYRIVAYDTLGNQAVSGVASYIVEDVVTTPTGPITTEPTTGPEPGPGDTETLFMIYVAFGALVVLVLALAVRRRD